MANDNPLKVSDLLLRDGRVYHLDLLPDELATDIIIFGDPDRVLSMADEFLAEREVDRSRRGLRTITGPVKKTGQRVSLISSGMGTPSLEIVLNEIIALNEIDFRTGRRSSDYAIPTIIRVGTSGGIQADTELGTLIITDYAIGLDNTGFFIDAQYSDNVCRMLEERIGCAIDAAIPNDRRFKGKIFPYAARADQNVVSALERVAQNLSIRYRKGLTISNSGFFANQGRDIARLPLTVSGIDKVLASVDTGIEGLAIENMEMEASFLLYMAGALGYRAGAICAVIDNRREELFAENYAQHIREAVMVALGALQAVRKDSAEKQDCCP
jgi:uridine phosphorylase